MALNKFFLRAALVACVVLVCFKLFGIGYFADDYNFLLRRTQGVHLGEIFTKNTDGTSVGGSWRPLTLLSFWISMSAQRPVVDHAVNIMLLCIIALLIFEIASEWWSRQYAWGVALIAVLLPIHVEPVAWIAARADLLAAVFGLAALLSWLRGSRWSALIWYIASLLSKEVWLLLPCALLLQPIPRRERARWATYFLSVAAVWVCVRYLITNYTAGGYSVPMRDTAEQIRHAGISIVAYATGVFTFGNFQATAVRYVTLHWKIASVLVAACAALLWRASARSIFILHVALLVPILFLEVPFRWTSATVQEQRYWFAPSIALVLLCAHIIYTYQRRTLIGTIILVITATGFIYNTRLFQKAALYRDVVFSAAKNSQRIGALPDTFSGVHLWAAPFYNNARELKALPPAHIENLYQVCDERCLSQPLTIITTSSTVELLSAPPRLLIVGGHGLSFEALFFKTQNSFEIWDGTRIVEISSQGVEKP